MTTPLPSPVVRASRAAFTLVELLTVVAIVGVLAAILIPVVGRARSAARDTQCLATTREWGKVILLYAADHKGAYTFSNWASAANDGPYMPYFANATHEVVNFRVCPLMPQDKISAGTLTYCIVRGAVDGKISKFISNSSKVPLNLARNPSRYLMLCDAQPNTNSYLSGSINTINSLVGPLFDPSIAKAGEEDYARRHGGDHINGVFGDGSVRRITGTPAGQGDRNSIYEMRTTWFQLY